MTLNFNGLFLAPLAGVSETVFRRICKKQGADVVVSEMVSAEGLLRAGKQTLRLLSFDESERPIGVQLFGAEPDRLAAAAVLVESEIKPDFIDLNSGCPVPKVVIRKSGAALLRDPARFERIVTAMAKAISIPLTVKIRSGWNTGDWVDVEFAKMAQGSGAQAIALHARSKTMGYSGNALWERIALVKQAVSIPVIGNGDIKAPGDALRMLQETGCDGVMIGRASFGNPWLFRQIKELIRGKPIEEILPEERCELILEHIDTYCALRNERLAAKDMRKHVAWYLKGMPNAALFRDQAFRTQTVADLKQIVKAAFSR